MFPLNGMWHLTPKCSLFHKKKVWSPAYLYGGSGKTLNWINNTPHPYGWTVQKAPMHSHTRWWVFCRPQFVGNLPDSHTRMKHTLSSICQSIPGNRPYKYRQFFSFLKKESSSRVRGIAAIVFIRNCEVRQNVGRAQHPFHQFQKTFDVKRKTRHDPDFKPLEFEGFKVKASSRITDI